MKAVGRVGSLGVLVAVCALAAAGCGETVIDSAKTEDAIEQNLERATGRKVTSVECPSEVEVSKGTTFDCSVSFAGGKREVATLKILNDDADVALTNLRPQGQEREPMRSLKSLFATLLVAPRPRAPARRRARGLSPLRRSLPRSGRAQRSSAAHLGPLPGQPGARAPRPRPARVQPGAAPVGGLLHSLSMVRSGSFSHYGPGASTVTSRAAQFGYLARVSSYRMAENIGAGEGSDPSAPRLGGCADVDAQPAAPGEHPRCGPAGLRLAGSPAATSSQAGSDGATYTLVFGARGS